MPKSKTLPIELPTLLIADKQLQGKLVCHERDIIKLMRRGKEVLFKLAHELYLARNTCLEHGSERTFGEWVRRFGMSKSSAYRAIARWEALAPKILGTPTNGTNRPNLGRSPPFEGFLCFAQFDDSAIDELAKASTPPKALNAAVKIAQAGKGMSRQEAIALIERHTKPKPASAPTPNEPIEVDSEPVAPDYGKCPNCAGVKWDDEDPDKITCVKCRHPWGEPAGDSDEEETPAPPKRKGQPPKQYDRPAWFKQWQQSIGPLVRLVDKIAAGVHESGCPSHTVVHEHLENATKELQRWMDR